MTGALVTSDVQDGPTGNGGQESLAGQNLSPPALTGLLLAVFFWGLSFPLIKLALDGGILPITLAVLRYLLGLIPLGVYVAVRRSFGELMRALKNDWGIFLALGLVGITLPNLLQNYGMMWTSAHVSSILQASGPVFTIMLAMLFLRERLGFKKILGTILAIIGTLLLITEGGMTLEGSTFIGNLLVLMSAISYAFSSILSKKALERYEPMTVAVLSIMTGTPFLAAVWAVESPWEHVPQISAQLWLVVLVLAVFPGVVALLLWYGVLKPREVSRLILFIYLIPVFATAIAYFIPGETIRFSTILFAFIITCGVMIAQYEKQEKANARVRNARRP